MCIRLRVAPTDLEKASAIEKNQRETFFATRNQNIQSITIFDLENGIFTLIFVAIRAKLWSYAGLKLSFWINTTQKWVWLKLVLRFLSISLIQNDRTNIC